VALGNLNLRSWRLSLGWPPINSCWNFASSASQCGGPSEVPRLEIRWRQIRLRVVKPTFVALKRTDRQDNRGSRRVH
jgi:hypothetical protein